VGRTAKPSPLGEHDGRALLRRAERDASADALPGARDEGDVATEATFRIAHPVDSCARSTDDGSAAPALMAMI
jgi:hypothetical protein